MSWFRIVVGLFFGFVDGFEWLWVCFGVCWQEFGMVFDGFWAGCCMAVGCVWLAFDCFFGSRSLEAEKVEETIPFETRMTMLMKMREELISKGIIKRKAGEI